MDRRARDLRGDLLEEMMAAYNLVVTNQPSVHTYEKRIARSVLDLSFASPEVTKNISSWEVLDAESLSDHRYIWTKLLGKQNQRGKYKTKGVWSLQRMNRNKFLQRISAANLEGSATAEEAAEMLMRIIPDACDASMPRRPSTYHRKPAYWWNEVLAELRNECNKRRRDFQRARKANRPNAIEEQEAYKEARRMFGSARGCQPTTH